MELILLHECEGYSGDAIVSFNPCFIGTYSFTKSKTKGWIFHEIVLILVLLELILLPHNKKTYVYDMDLKF